MRDAFNLGSRRYFELREVPDVFAAPDKALRLLILADDLHPANVVQDHIRSFSEFSTHRVSIVNTRSVKRPDPSTAWNFDALLIHYSIWVTAETYLSVAWQEFVSAFPGPVAVIHEDEYQRINAFTQKFKELGVQAVFSCLDSKETLERVYGVSALPSDTLFFSCLPGYIAPYLLGTSPPPISGRPFDVVYRGRTLRPELGRFAQEKRLIGEQMLALGLEHGLACDISSEEDARIYGAQWLKFLMSGKAMLGVEGGASIFDHDGTISDAVATYTRTHPSAEFEEIWANVLTTHEGNINFRTITPKFFEAIAAKTALVLYPGKYNNVLIPDRHFIPLERDGSNVAEVVAKLKDHCYLQAMADRTYEEVLHKAELGARFYVNQIDRVLSALADHTSTSKLLRISIAERAFQARLQQQLITTQLEMELATEFDAVVMLTWSDWKNEPRSNRYHYASRFARTLPVLFLQHSAINGHGIYVEPSEINGLDIVNVNSNRDLAGKCAEEVIQLLAARGIRRPLVWIYDSIYYQALIDLLPRAFKVYHATEDYLTETSGWNQSMDVVAKSIINLIPLIDFMVFVSQGIVDSYYKRGGYRGLGELIENGCDAEYFIECADTDAVNISQQNLQIAIFQGGINQRLDYQLLIELVQRLPEWEFHFCGAAIESVGWRKLQQQANVRYLGVLTPKELSQHMCLSTVGIIPYVQEKWIRNSLPLKAYEYVACGLPVVTVPITTLERDPDLMTIATTPAEFEGALLKAAESRFDSTLLKRRREAALGKSYNVRFDSMCRHLLKAHQAVAIQKKSLKLAVLYDSVDSLHVSTIHQHLDAFGKYSSHAVTYVPAHPLFWNLPPEKVQTIVDFSYFDVVVIHYSVRLSAKQYLDEGLARALESFNGLKVLFIQDEYEGTEIARQWMDRLQFNLVYTCVPESSREQVYPSYRFPGTEFLQTLTGYVPENSAIEQYAQPIGQRQLLIAYRGRKLPAVYGDLGYEKYRIGIGMKRLTAALGVPADIEVDGSKRIYGDAWYQFLGSSRATLGTESGANIFDFDGSLKTAIAQLEAHNPSISYEEISAKILAPYDGLIRMNQISPRVFEAICMRTALVLFEGTYSNVVLPDVHFFALKKDFSNAKEIIRKLQDTPLVQEMTERAYRDVVASGQYSYKSFIHSFDADIEARIPRGNRLERINAPLHFAGSDKRLRQALPMMPAGLLLGGQDSHWELSDFSVEDKWRTVLPFGLRVVVLARNLGKLVRRNQSAFRSKSLLFQITRRCWHLLPLGVRIRLAQILRLS